MNPLSLYFSGLTGWGGAWSKVYLEVIAEIDDILPQKSKVGISGDPVSTTSPTSGKAKAQSYR